MRENKQIKIGMVNSINPISQFGGAEFTLADMSAEFESRGHELYWAYLSNESFPAAKACSSMSTRGLVFEMPRRNINDNFVVLESISRKLLWHLISIIPRHFFLLRKWIKDNSLDIVFVHSEYGFPFVTFIAARVCKIPTVKVLHDYSFLCFNGRFAKDVSCKKICNKCQLNSFFRKKFVPSAFVGVSQSMIEWLRKFYFSTPNGSKALVYYPRIKLQKPKANVVRKYEFGYLGRITHEKGIETLLEQLARIDQKLFLAGVGSPIYMDYLYRKYPNSIFLGWQDKNDFLNNVKTLVVPSEWKEPFGRVVPEAAIMGCRVVFASQPGMLEAASVVQGSYFPYEPNDSEALLKAIAKAANSSNSQDAAKHFSREYMAQPGQLVNLIEELCEERNSWY